MFRRLAKVWEHHAGAQAETKFGFTDGGDVVGRRHDWRML